MQIDTDIWMTQQGLADELKIGISTVHNWVWRKKIETLQYPNSTLILVNKNSLKLNDKHHKRKPIVIHSGCGIDVP